MKKIIGKSYKLSNLRIIVVHLNKINQDTDIDLKQGEKIISVYDEKNPLQNYFL